MTMTLIWKLLNNGMRWINGHCVSTVSRVFKNIGRRIVSCRGWSCLMRFRSQNKTKNIWMICFVCFTSICVCECITTFCLVWCPCNVFSPRDADVNLDMKKGGLEEKSLHRNQNNQQSKKSHSLSAKKNSEIDILTKMVILDLSSCSALYQSRILKNANLWLCRYNLPFIESQQLQFLYMRTTLFIDLQALPYINLFLNTRCSRDCSTITFVIH